MRIISRGPLMFDVDAETGSTMAILMREMLEEMLAPHLQSLLVDRIAEKIMEEYTADSLSEHMSRRVSTIDIADYVRRDVIGHLISDERFNSRMMRHIGDATVGVTNEAVERVTSIIKAQTTNNGDI